jgi:NTE family protein
MKKQFQLVSLSILMLFAGYSCSKKFMVIDSPLLQPPARILKERPNVALVLGGGAFHGMAHAGVIKALEDAGIPIDLIVGTSAGSMVGALYADNPNIDDLIPLIKSTKAKDVFDFSLSSVGFVSGKKLQRYMTNQLRATQIEDTQIPFVAVTTDIEKGKSVALKAGPISASVNASCAIPGIFEPVKMYGTTFVDGGVIDGVPVNIAKEYHPKYIIAVKITQFDTTVVLKSRKKVVLRGYDVASHYANKESISLANIIIQPNLKGLSLMGGKDNEKIYKLGIIAAKEMLPEIRSELKKRNILK